MKSCITTFCRDRHCPPHTNSPYGFVNRGSAALYRYAELAVSTPAAAVTIASTHCAYLWSDSRAEVAWVAG